jgi:hypothetical protein
MPEWQMQQLGSCDPAIAPSVYVGERFGIMPEVFIAMSCHRLFMNDEHRLKSATSGRAVNDRPHKSNVA